VTVKMPEMSE